MKRIKRRMLHKEPKAADSDLNKINSAHRARTYYNTGYDLHKRGDIDGAIINYQKSIQLDPNFAPAYYHLGTAFHTKTYLDEAVRYYQKAIQLDPNLIGAYYNLGTIFQGKRQLDKAIILFQKVIDLNPNLVDPYYNMALAFQEQGQQKEALTLYGKALQVNPSFLLARWAGCMAQIPVIYTDPSSVVVAQENYRGALLTLRDSISLKTPQEIDAATEAIGKQQPFFLPYQGLNDRELQEIYGNLVCRIMSARYPQYAVRPPSPSLPSGEPLRIGIASGFFYYHAVWKIPIKGWIENLDKKRFNLFGYYTGTKKDTETDKARKCFTRFVEDVFSFEELCRIIRNDNLHALIFPEIGMDPTTVKLASLRLAPVQCASWGHPETSGLPTIDYYISGEMIEPFDGNLHYTEELIRLPNLSLYYTPPEITAADLKRENFGLRQDSVLYHCCQSIYKFSAKYDDVFPVIAREVGNCQFLFVSYPNIGRLVELFRTRINNSFSKFNMNAEDYIVFLPPLPPEWYQALNLLSNVYLDTIGWSGCNSVLEALACNTPVVTLPTGLMRGREAFAILTMMGVTETITATPEEYAACAARLGKDREWRRYVSEKIDSARHLVYQDRSAIAGLEAFLERVVRERLE